MFSASLFSGAVTIAPTRPDCARRTPRSTAEIGEAAAIGGERAGQDRLAFWTGLQGAERRPVARRLRHLGNFEVGRELRARLLQGAIAADDHERELARSRSGPAGGAAI